MNNTDLKNLLFELSQSDCVNSRHEAAQKAFEIMKNRYPDTRFDRMGNIISVIKQPNQNGSVLLDAHIDEIAFVVTTIDNDGFLHLGKVGGIDFRVLLGQEVTVIGKTGLTGIICCRPPHLSSQEEYKKLPSIDEIAVDIGLGYDKAVEFVSPGDYVFLRRSPSELQNGLITGKALDNRAGVAAIINALDITDIDKLNTGVAAVFSVSEECGERGAVVSSFSTCPTAAVVVDVSHGLAPEYPADKCGEINKGPMIGISPVLSAEITKLLFDCAENKAVKFQKEIMADLTGTNSDVISVSREGVKTGLVSIPLRSMHTAAEVISLDDIEETSQLLAEFLLTYRGENID